LPTLQKTGAARNFTTRSQSQLKGWQRSVSRNQQASKHTKHAQVHVGGRTEAPGGHEHDATSASSVPAAAASENRGSDDRRAHPSRDRNRTRQDFSYLFGPAESFSRGRGTSTPTSSIAGERRAGGARLAACPALCWPGSGAVAIETAT
jgi:hypothetical protein